MNPAGLATTMSTPMLAMGKPGVVDFDAVKLGRDKTAQHDSPEA